MKVKKQLKKIKKYFKSKNIFVDIYLSKTYDKYILDNYEEHTLVKFFIQNNFMEEKYISSPIILIDPEHLWEFMTPFFRQEKIKNLLNDETKI